MSKTPPAKLSQAMKPLQKLELHPRNAHRHGYDFAALMNCSPALAPFVSDNKYGNPSINFADPNAVKALNAALLKQHYQIMHWDIPDGFLCPPIPGRVDYMHYLADLLSHCPPPASTTTTILDIGTGANLIYPLLGFSVYHWSFVGVDINVDALHSAQHLIDSNALSAHITLRQQKDPISIFDHIIAADDYFAATLCNPPFHASAQAAAYGAQRKWRNLKGKKFTPNKPLLNFGGQQNELYCDGGEAAFIHRMISESQHYANQVGWFTTLVSNADLMPSLRRALSKLNKVEYKTIAMAQGQKVSRLLAWTFNESSAAPSQSRQT